MGVRGRGWGAGVSDFFYYESKSKKKYGAGGMGVVRSGGAGLDWRAETSEFFSMNPNFFLVGRGEEGGG